MLSIDRRRMSFFNFAKSGEADGMRSSSCSVQSQYFPHGVLPVRRIRSRTRRETLSPKSALRFAILQRRTPNAPTAPDDRTVPDIHRSGAHQLTDVHELQLRTSTGDRPD